MNNLRGKRNKRTNTIQDLKDFRRASVSVRRRQGGGYKPGRKEKEIHGGGWRDIFMAQELENFGGAFQANASGSWLNAKCMGSQWIEKHFCLQSFSRTLVLWPWARRSIWKHVRNAHSWAQHQIYWREALDESPVIHVQQTLRVILMHAEVWEPLLHHEGHWQRSMSQILLAHLCHFFWPVPFFLQMLMVVLSWADWEGPAKGTRHWLKLIPYFWMVLTCLLTKKF